MKKLLFFVGILALEGALYGGTAGNPSGQGKDPSNYNSISVNKSTDISIVTSSKSIVISTTASMLTCLTINTPGTNSFFELWTPTASVILDTTTLNWNTSTTTLNSSKIAKIDTTSKATLWYPGFYPYGVLGYNGFTSGGAAADVTIFYLDKR